MRKINMFQEREVAILLRTFSAKECKDFLTFLQARSTRNVVQLWKLLRKKHPFYNIEDSLLYRKIRLGQTYNDKVYRQWVAELYSQAKAFVTIRDFEENKALYNNVQSMALLRRKAKNGFEKTMKVQRKMMAKNPRHNSDFYFYRYQMEAIRYQFITILHKHRGMTDSLQLASDYHDEYFLVYKLKYLLTMHNRERIVSETYEYRMQKIVFCHLEENPRPDVPLLHLYYLLVKIMVNFGERILFLEFLDYFKSNQSLIAISELRQFLTSATNICYWNILEGRLEYLEDRFELTKIMIEDEYIMVDGYFPHYHFRNIMRIAIEAGELNWATHFLEENLPKTEKQYQENLSTFNHAYLHFAKKEVDLQSPYMKKMQKMKSKDNPEGFEFIDIFHELAYRILLLKTDYVAITISQNNSERQLNSFQRQLDSFRNYLNRRKKIPENTILSHQNFRKGLSLVFHAQYGKKTVSTDLRGDIMKLLPMVELPWLWQIISL